MENIKVRVNSAEESKEVQELFFELGYKFSMVDFCKYYNSVQVFDDGSGSLFEDHDTCSHKELTIPQLRDLVILKRNDVNDATHTDQDGWKWYIGADSYVWQAGNSQQLKQWDQSSLAMVDLKPIEKEMKMKEYLDKNYNLVHHKTDIEVPEGAETATISKGKRIEFWKDEGFTWWCSEDKEWKISGTLQIHIDNCGHVVVWQRTPSVDVVDNVNHPTHYTSGAVECIEAIESSMSAEAFKGFLKGNVQKYMWRYEQKGGAESLEKAQWYLNLLLSRVSS